MTTKPTKKEQPEETIETLTDKVKRLQIEVDCLGKVTSSLNAAMPKATKMAREAIGLCDGKTLESARRDAAYVHAMYRAAFSRITAATEAVWFVGKINPAVAANVARAAVSCFDLPNSWWVDRDAWTIERWVSYFMEVAESGPPSIDGPICDNAPTYFEDDEHK